MKLPTPSVPIPDLGVLDPLNTAGAPGATAIGGLISSQTCVSTLPGGFAGVDVTTLTTIGSSLGNISSRCVDKLNELYNERGVYADSTVVDPTVRNTGNKTGSYSDNLSLTAILSDTKKRLA